jgi:hypothetical protein
VQRVPHLRVRHPRHAWLDDVASDANLALGEIDRPWSPDLERVHPCVVGVGSRQGRVLAEVANRRAVFEDGNAVCEESNLLAVLGRDLGVNVQLAATIRANVGFLAGVEEPRLAVRRR